MKKIVPFLIFFSASTMSEYELLKKQASYDNFEGFKSMVKEPQHKLFMQNKHSAPSVYTRTYMYALVYRKNSGKRLNSKVVPRGLLPRTTKKTIMLGDSLKRLSQQIFKICF